MKKIKFVLIAMLLSATFLMAYMHHLGQIVEEKFGQQDKWNLPSRVFSDAEYLYPGIDIKQRDLLAKLDRLSYRNSGDSIQSPGDYSINSSHLDIYLHDFSYPNEVFKGFPVRIGLRNHHITSIENKLEGQTLELVRLEPEMLASIFDERMEDRTEIKLSDVPPHLAEAIILIEDERFFKHHGVDPVGILRAAVADVIARKIVQGGSTLTQQLVKNYFLHSRKSFLRKINEALMAIELEKKYSKSEILQAYLNEIYLGQRGSSSISGVAKAAQFYFAKDVGQLSLAECALLAGLIQAPNSHSPFNSVERAEKRRNIVLQKMFEEQLISAEEFQSAKAEKINPPKRNIKLVTAPYFIDFVKMQLAELYPQEVLEKEGLSIFTSLDMTAQLAAEASVEDGLNTLEKNYASLLPKDHAGLLQACLIAIQPSTGFIRSMVGGRNYQASQYNRCVQALRQPGSTFKPFVYLTAFDGSRGKQPYTPATLVSDMSFEVTSGGEKWSPKNYEKEEHGLIRARTALEHSYNIATARIAIDVGLENVVKTARDAGISSSLQPVPSLSLGAFEVTPLEMASSYTIFPNSGIRAEPISILNVMTKEGEVLERRDVSMKRVFDPVPVYLTTQVLEGVIDRGTGASVRSFGFRGAVAGKTGTTSNYRDAWFIGFTPNFLALSWVGYDDNTSTKMSGARAALPLWASFMKQVANDGTQTFTIPAGVSLVKIDTRTGGIYKRKCGDVFVEAFADNNLPAQDCDEFQLDSEVELH